MIMSLLLQKQLAAEARAAKLDQDPDIQAQMLKPPYDVIPTNSKVKLEGAITQAIAKNQDDLAKIRTIDWDKLNPQRGALIDRFNREIKL